MKFVFLKHGNIVSIWFGTVFGMRMHADWSCPIYETVESQLGGIIHRLCLPFFTLYWRV